MGYAEYEPPCVSASCPERFSADYANVRLCRRIAAYVTKAGGRDLLEAEDPPCPSGVVEKLGPEQDTHKLVILRAALGVVDHQSNDEIR